MKGETQEDKSRRERTMQLFVHVPLTNAAGYPTKNADAYSGVRIRRARTDIEGAIFPQCVRRAGGRCAS